MILMILERIWMEYFSIFSSGPDLVLLVLVYFAAFHSPEKGLILAFVTGFITDSIVGINPGLNAAIYTFLFWAMASLSKRFFLRSLVFQFIAAAGITIAYKFSEFTLLTIFEMPVEIRIQLWWGLPGEMFANLIAAPFVFKLLEWIEDLSTPSLLRRNARFDRAF